MKTLSKDIILYITSYLTLSDILSLSLSSKKHQNVLFDNNIFWINRVLLDYRKFGHIPKIVNKKYRDTNWKKYYINLNYLKDKNIHQVFSDSSKLGKTDMIRLLLNDNRIDPSVKNSLAIRWASKYGQDDVVKLLLSDGRIDPSAGDNYGVRWASGKGHTDIVGLLLNDNRTDPSARNNLAIRWASKYGHLEVVKLLLTDGRTDPLAQDNYAIKEASKNGYLNIVKLLL